MDRTARRTDTSPARSARLLVRTSVTLPEPHNAEEHWYVNRLINEALAGLRRADALPVHINVPLSEPLYHFTVPALPDERTFLERHERGARCPGN